MRTSRELVIGLPACLISPVGSMIYLAMPLGSSGCYYLTWVSFSLSINCRLRLRPLLSARRLSRGRSSMLRSTDRR